MHVHISLTLHTSIQPAYSHYIHVHHPRITLYIYIHTWVYTIHSRYTATIHHIYTSETHIHIIFTLNSGYSQYNRIKIEKTQSMYIGTNVHLNYQRQPRHHNYIGSSSHPCPILWSQSLPRPSISFIFKHAYAHTYL